MPRESAYIAKIVDRIYLGVFRTYVHGQVHLFDVIETTRAYSDGHARTFELKDRKGKPYAA